MVFFDLPGGGDDRHVFKPEPLPPCLHSVFDPFRPKLSCFLFLFLESCAEQAAFDVSRLHKQLCWLSSLSGFSPRRKIKLIFYCSFNVKYKCFEFCK